MKFHDITFHSISVKSVVDGKSIIVPSFIANMVQSPCVCAYLRKKVSFGKIARGRIEILQICKLTFVCITMETTRARNDFSRWLNFAFSRLDYRDVRDRVTRANENKCARRTQWNMPLMCQTCAADSNLPGYYLFHD